MLPIFAFTLFVSALLLFVVQPMAGKMILPSLGGTPAVWTTCMVFFQAVLLAGYAYAHGSVRLLGVRRQAGLHVVLLLAPLLVLPVALDTSNVPSSSDNPVFWLLGRLLVGVGLPFFLVSTTAPLLQFWFSHTGHKDAHDPYFLYGASNVGSLIALLGYPLLFERLWDVPAQSWYWMVGYLALAGLVLACAVMLWMRSRATAAVHDNLAAAEPDSNSGAAVAEPVTWLRRLRWVFLSFVPSSLMLGATTHVTIDLAPVPLLWVVPLALYLLTFVLVFARRPLIPHGFVLNGAPFLLVPIALMAVQGDQEFGWWAVPLHFVMLFAAGMLCHGELVADRPSPRYLTEFYLWMSVGGVMGGIFNAIVAPLAFRTIVEYPLVIVIACLAPRVRREAGGLMRRYVAAAGLGVLSIAVAWGALKLIHSEAWPFSPSKLQAILGLSVFCVLWRKHPAWLCAGLAGALIGSVWGSPERADKNIYVGRNFFGVKSVALQSNGNYAVFYHGHTIHGVQDRRRPNVPLAYFHPTGPMGEVFATYRAARTPRQVAIIGLGAGALAAYAERQDRFDFYEIDPEVGRIAENPELFTFMRDCQGKRQILLGDGRLRLAEIPDGTYGLIVLDAFSSDAVPTHLLTREALALYLRKLDERGLIVFNISNRYLNLAPLLAALAEETGLVSYLRDDHEFPVELRKSGKLSSRFLVMARTPENMRPLIFHESWIRQIPDQDFPIWTDQFSSIFSVVAW